MGPGDTRWRRLLALACTLTVGGLGVWGGIASDDPVLVGVAVGFVVVVLLLGGPVLRWLRRGDGPYATSGEADRSREEYLRIRYPGDNRGG